MKITDLTGVLRGLDPRDAHRGDSAPAPRPPAENRETEYGDRLDLSVSARMTATSGQTPEAVSEVQSGLSAARLAEIRQRIGQGHYSRPEVLDETARRLLDFHSR